MTTALPAMPALAAARPTGARAAGVQAWLLAALAALVPLVCSSALSDGFEIPKLAIVKIGLALALLVVASRAYADAGVLRTPAAIAAVIFVGVCGLATITSIEPRTSLLGSYTAQRGLEVVLVEVGWFVLAASWVRTESAFARVAWGFTLAGVLAGAYALVQVAGFDPLGFPKPVNDPRPDASFGYPNSLAEFLALSLPLTGWLVWRGAGLRRDVAVWALLPQIAGVVIAQARTAWVAVLLEVLLVGPLVVCSRRRSLGGLGVGLTLVPLVASVTACFVVLFAPGAASAVRTGTEYLLGACPEGACPYRGEPMQTRLALWGSATAMISARPVLGWGPDTFGLVYPGFRSVELDTLDGSVGGDDMAHNVLLDTGVSAGLLGLVAAAAVYTAVLSVLLRAAFGRTASDSRRGMALALLLGWTTYLVLFSTGRQRLVTDWQAWIYAGLALGLFVPRPGWRWHLAPAARLTLAGVALVLVVDATTAVVADGAARAGQGLAPTLALGTLERAVALRPFEPTYQRDLGVALHESGVETGNANLQASGVDHLTAASTLAGNRSPSLLVELARGLESWQDATGQPTDGPLRFADQAIRLDPASPLPYADAAELALIRHRADLGSAYWEAARVRTRTPDALRRLGEVAVELGEADAARVAFKAATAREWRAFEKGLAARAWGEAALAEGLPDEAAQAYAQVLELAPTDSAARASRIEALVTAGQASTALAELQLAQQADPSDPILAELGRRLRQQSP